MAKRSRGNAISWKQVVIALVLTISVAYGVAIVDVLSRTVRETGRVEALQAEVDALQAQSADLETRIEEALSVVHIEDVARSELRRHRAGEVSLVPIAGTPAAEEAPQAAPPAPRATPRPTISGSLAARWQELLRLVLRGIGR